MAREHVVLVSELYFDDRKDNLLVPSRRLTRCRGTFGLSYIAFAGIV
jgi:hypothetical protein